MPPLARLRTSVSSSSKVPSAFGMAVLEGNGFLDRDLAGGSDFAVRGAGDLSSAASPLSAKISSAIGPGSVTLGTGRRRCLAEDALAVEGLEPGTRLRTRRRFHHVLF